MKFNVFISVHDSAGAVYGTAEHKRLADKSNKIFILTKSTGVESKSDKRPRRGKREKTRAKISNIPDREGEDESGMQGCETSKLMWSADYSYVRAYFSGLSAKNCVVLTFTRVSKEKSAVFISRVVPCFYFCFRTSLK